MNVVELLRSRWRKWNVHRAQAGDAAAMDRLYLLPDPWRLNTGTEEVRFQHTVRIIKESLGQHFGTILEVGCGEGVQTQYLARLAGKITGLEPSRHAIQRARAKGIAGASFEVGDLCHYQPLNPEPFDLVVACEVLYYLSNLQQAFDRLNALGCACLVTYYQGVFERLDPFFVGKDVESQMIEGPNCRWKAVYWRREGVSRRQLSA